MKLHSNAKINLGLNVLRKRSDNFHKIQSIIIPIELFDELQIKESQKFAFTEEGMDQHSVINENLCVQAYELFKETYGIPEVEIHLKKNIPIGAGLGGGSSNAAFILKALNHLFDLGLTTEELKLHASKLGSDCAFFIDNEIALARGRGDKLETLSLDLKNYEILLINPGIHISTTEAYAGVIPHKNNFSLGGIATLSKNEWQQNIVNDFEKNIFLKYPELPEIKNKLIQAGAIYSSMSGSGSTIYALFEKNNVPQLKWPEQYFIWRGNVFEE